MGKTQKVVETCATRVNEARRGWCCSLGPRGNVASAFLRAVQRAISSLAANRGLPNSAGGYISVVPDIGIGEASGHDRRSYWIASTEAPELSSLEGSLRADVVVIGAGIVGSRPPCDLRGRSQGRLLEAHRVAGGVSGYTTAKLTAGHGLGLFAPRTRLWSGPCPCIRWSRRPRRSTSSETSADERRSSAISRSARTSSILHRTRQDGRRGGGCLAGAVGFPRPGSGASFPGAATVQLTGQAQFHVRKYLLGFLVRDAGGQVFENSRVEEITGTKPYETHAAGGTVSAPLVVVATHYPIVGQGFFATRIHPRQPPIRPRSATPRDVDLDGMFITAAPTRSFRDCARWRAGACSWSEARATCR